MVCAGPALNHINEVVDLNQSRIWLKVNPHDSGFARDGNVIVYGKFAYF